MKKTPHFEKCTAPLCLEADDIDDNSIWYANEPICSAQPKTGTPNWIKQQRKIARQTKQNPEIGFFTLEMLKRNCVVGKGMKGINGDKQNTKWQIKRWFEKHKTKRKLSEKEKEVIRERFKKNVLSN